MPEQKPNRRVQFTKTALRNAFIELIAEKPLQSITVTDICARADINRSTFYLHYKDVRDLTEEIENEILDSLRHRLAKIPFTAPAFAEELQRIKNTPREMCLMRALLGEQGDPRFIRSLQELTYESFNRACNDRMFTLPENYKPIIYSFLITGIIASLAGWLQGISPDMDATELGNLIHTMIERGISDFNHQQL